jgi:hypothetical protein
MIDPEEIIFFFVDLSVNKIPECYPITQERTTESQYSIEID